MDFYFTKDEAVEDILSRYGNFCFDKALSYEEIAFKTRDNCMVNSLKTMDTGLTMPFKTQKEQMPDRRTITGNVKGIDGDEMRYCKVCGERTRKSQLIDDICGFCEKHKYDN